MQRIARCSLGRRLGLVGAIVAGSVVGGAGVTSGEEHSGAAPLASRQPTPEEIDAVADTFVTCAAERGVVIEGFELTITRFKVGTDYHYRSDGDQDADAVVTECELPLADIAVEYSDTAGIPEEQIQREVRDCIESAGLDADAAFPAAGVGSMPDDDPLAECYAAANVKYLGAP